jgi:hypothetical protein
MSKTRMMASATLVALGALALGGCVVRGRAHGAVVVPRPVVYAPRPVVYTQPTTTVITTPAPGPVYVAPPPGPPACGVCYQGAQEVCNGCDDNCNGVIDEGCR